MKGLESDLWPSVQNSPPAPSVDPKMYNVSLDIVWQNLGHHHWWRWQFWDVGKAAASLAAPTVSPLRVIWAHAHTWLDPEMWPPKINCTVHPILFPVTDLVVVVKWVVSKWGNSVHLTVCARCSHHQWGFIHFETLCQIHKKTFNQKSSVLRWQKMICEHT